LFPGQHKSGWVGGEVEWADIKAHVATAGTGPFSKNPEKGRTLGFVSVLVSAFGSFFYCGDGVHARMIWTGRFLKPADEIELLGDIPG
jgi:hypothetical protein